MRFIFFWFWEALIFSGIQFLVPRTHLITSSLLEYVNSDEAPIKVVVQMTVQTGLVPTHAVNVEYLQVIDEGG